MKKILLHICCGPCALMPVKALREEGCEVTGFFMNPNIHPLGEYLKRREALAQCAEKLDLPVIWRDEAWNIQEWLAQRAGKRDSGEARCASCYAQRLEAASRAAAAGGFDAFTTTLLYSRRQRHELIAASGRDAAQSRPGSAAPIPGGPERAAPRQETPCLGSSLQDPESRAGRTPFLYRDFRPLWQQGIDESKAMGLYRQNYCGCIYSEAERFEKNLKKLFAANFA